MKSRIYRKSDAFLTEHAGHNRQVKNYPQTGREHDRSLPEDDAISQPDAAARLRDNGLIVRLITSYTMSEGAGHFKPQAPWCEHMALPCPSGMAFAGQWWSEDEICKVWLQNSAGGRQNRFRIPDPAALELAVRF
jgi:hypothetical protein